jgi:colanic acid biosynthesis glycosyl transferase WcaI
MGIRRTGSRVSGTTYLVRGAFRPGSDAVSRSILELALSMQRVGHNIKIISWTGPGDFGMLDDASSGTVHVLGSKSGNGRYTSADRAIFLLKATFYLWKNARAGDNVVTLEDPTALGLVALPLRLKNGIKHYTYLMDLQSIQYLWLNHGGVRSTTVNRLRRALDRVTWRASNAVIVLGECMKEVVQKLEPRANIMVIPIWQDGSRIHSVEPAAARRRLRMDDKLVVMYHGHATYRQPMQLILAAALELQDDPEVLFAVVGNGPSVDWLRQAALERELANIEVYERVPDLDFLEVLSSADVHLAILDERATGTCVPSKTYTAMAVARPCLYIGAQSGQAAIDVLDAEAGYVIGTNDLGKFVSHVREFSSNAEGRMQMGNRGLEYFSRERDLSVISKKWTDLLVNS